MIAKLLEDREERYNTILSLIEEYNLPVICGKVNYPGRDKSTDTANNIFNILKDKLCSNFNDFIVFSKSMDGEDGKSLILVVNMKAMEVKKLAVSIEEENKLGRLFDIDVYNSPNGPITRGEVGLPSRKCILCNEDPRVCRKLNKHEIGELLKEIDNILYAYKREL